MNSFKIVHRARAIKKLNSWITFPKHEPIFNREDMKYITWILVLFLFNIDIIKDIRGIMLLSIEIYYCFMSLTCSYILVYCKVRYFLVKQISLSDSFFALFNFLTWSNKYKIPNHLSGIKLHFKCLQIYLFAFHQRVMFPENHCMIRHLINNVWKRISSNKKDKAIPKYFHNLTL